MYKKNVFLVGGAVRDKLLKIPVKERDWVVVGINPQDLLNNNFRQVGKDFPVFLHPETKEEYALARKERKVGAGYHGFEFISSPNVTLEEDLERRDLTINAIAEDMHGKLIDPYNGVVDIKNKLLRHVSEAFVEDPVRVLRVARFLARFYYIGFSIAPETMKLMQKMVKNGEVDALVSERVWLEFAKALQEKNPEQFILALKQCGALEVLFPEIYSLFGVPQKKEWHPEIDCGVHTLMVLQQAVLLSNKPEVCFAALVHDLGKGNTPQDILPSHRGHEERGVKKIHEMAERLKIPNSYKNLAVKAARYHGVIHRIKELKSTTIVNVLKKLDAFRNYDLFYDVLTVCEADAKGRKGFEDIIYTQKDLWLGCYHVAKEVSAKELCEQGFSGMKLANKLHELQATQIKKYLLNKKGN